MYLFLSSADTELTSVLYSFIRFRWSVVFSELVTDEQDFYDFSLTLALSDCLIFSVANSSIAALLWGSASHDAVSFNCQVFWIIVKTVKDSLSTKDAATYLNSFEAFVYGDMIMFVRCSQSVEVCRIVIFFTPRLFHRFWFKIRKCIHSSK